MRTGSFLSLLLPFVFSPLVVPSAQADLYKCDGAWGATPCTGVTEEHLPESLLRSGISGVAPAPKQEPLAPRYEVIRSLQKLNSDYRSKGGIALSDVEVRGVKDACLRPETTRDECVRLFSAAKDRLITLNQEAERNRIEQERNVIEAEKLRRHGIVIHEDGR